MMPSFKLNGFLNDPCHKADSIMQTDPCVARSKTPLRLSMPLKKYSVRSRRSERLAPGAELRRAPAFLLFLSDGWCTFWAQLHAREDAPYARFCTVYKIIRKHGALVAVIAKVCTSDIAFTSLRKRRLRVLAHASAPTWRRPQTFIMQTCLRKRVSPLRTKYFFIHEECDI